MPPVHRPLLAAHAGAAALVALATGPVGGIFAALVLAAPAYIVRRLP